MKKVFTVCVLLGAVGCGGIEEAGQPLSDNIEDEVASFLESSREISSKTP